VTKDERFYLKISRVTVVAVGIVAFLGALQTPELVLNIVSYAVALVGVAFFFPMLFGLNSPSITRRAATLSSVGGAVVCFAWTILHLQRVPWALDLHPAVPGLVIALLPMLLVRRAVDMSPAAFALFFPELKKTSGAAQPA
jgi:Na+/proline symporter